MDPLFETLYLLWLNAAREIAEAHAIDSPEGLARSIAEQTMAWAMVDPRRRFPFVKRFVRDAARAAARKRIRKAQAARIAVAEDASGADGAEFPGVSSG